MCSGARSGGRDGEKGDTAEVEGRRSKVQGRRKEAKPPQPKRTADCFSGFAPPGATKSPIRNKHMASNKLPRNNKLLFTAAEDAKNGADEHAATIPLKQNDAEAIVAETGAARAALTNLKIAESAFSEAGKAVVAADNKVKAFLVSAKAALVAPLGNGWNALFGEAGFSSNSLELPRSPELRAEMLATMRDFLTRRPQYQDAREIVNVTSARATALYNELDAARKAANLAETAKTNAMDARDEALQKLRRRLSGLTAELRQTLEADAKEWYSFGLTPPANPSVPGELESRVVTRQLGADDVELTWGAAPRSTRYAIYVHIEGEVSEPVRVTSVRDRLYVLRGLPRGKAIQIGVAGVNRAGEGPVTAAIEITLPLGDS
jgi:hypothetical protein